MSATFANSDIHAASPSRRLSTSNPQGLLAIDQGHRPYRTQVRVYLYPESDTLTLWLVHFGDKRQQNADIAYCLNWLARRRLLP